jgi:peptidyl-prolyl cis-trans isomerase C
MSRFLFLLIVSLGVIIGGCQDEAVRENVAEKAETARLGRVEVAKVGDSSIYRMDVERLALEKGNLAPGETLEQTDPVFQQLLEELIDQRLLSQAALRRGLDKTTENKRRLAAARERILGNILVEEHLKETVNDNTIRRMYDQQAELANRGDEIRARHILLSDEASALAAQTALAEGQGFAELARSVSIDAGSREQGGDLGWFTRDMLNLEFTRKVFATPVGERTEPFQTSQGWHIAEVQNRRGSQQQSFEELRPNIVKFMTFDAIQSLLQELRRKSEIETYYSLDPENGVTLPPETDGADGTDGGEANSESGGSSEEETTSDDG